MKSYTDLEQSKKLAEILSIESADMVYIKHATSNNPDWRFDDDIPPMILGKASIKDMTVEVLPCWSLAALLCVLPMPELIQNSEGTWLVRCWIERYPWSIGGYDNPVDACYEMILKLNKLKML